MGIFDCHRTTTPLAGVHCAAGLSLALGVLMVLGAATPAAAKCRKGQRLVPKQTPVLGGPGLGFETIAVVKKEKCLKVLQASPDGSFALVQLEAQKAGWVATGLVDATLSAVEGAEEVAVDGEQTRVLIRETAVRSAPRFDADATDIIPAGSSVSIQAKSPDGQWIRVAVESKGKTFAGWIIRFATAEKAVEEGAEPSAGSGAWSVGQAPKPPVVAPDDETSRPSTLLSPKKEGESPSSKGEEDKPKTDKGEETASEDGKPVAPLAPVVGRTSAVYFGLHVPNVWVEQYRSDAIGDAYHAYDLQSLGMGLYGGYALRSNSNPFVLDIRVDATANPFFAVELGTPEPVLLIAGQGTASSYVGWRVHETETVDVDMGLTPAISSILNPGFGEQSDVARAFASNIYLDILRPTVNARSRMGAAGMMVLEASAFVGTMIFLPDPGATYEETPEADRPPLPDVTRPPLGEDDGELAQPLPFHLAVGAIGRIQYSYPMTESLLLDIGANLAVRQAIVSGPGLRTGAYLQANQVDVTASIVAGITFGL